MTLSPNIVLLSWFLILLISVPSYFAGKQGRRIEYIIVKEHDTVEIVQSVTDSMYSLEDEDAYIPTEEKNEKRRV